MNREQQQKLQNRRITQLVTYISDNPDGVTVDGMQAELGLDYSTTRKLIHAVRIYLRDSGFDLCCNPSTIRRGRWIYYFTGDWQEGNQWLSFRLRDTQGRIKTVEAVMTALFSKLDGRSSEGRAAKRCLISVRHLEENLDVLVEEFV
jgi:hypothetical protein